MKIIGIDFHLEKELRGAMSDAHLPTKVNLISEAGLKELEGKRITGLSLRNISGPYAGDGTIMYLEIEAE